MKKVNTYKIRIYIIALIAIIIAALQYFKLAQLLNDNIPVKNESLVYFYLTLFTVLLIFLSATAIKLTRN